MIAITVSPEKALEMRDFARVQMGVENAIVHIPVGTDAVAWKVVRMPSEARKRFMRHLRVCSLLGVAQRKYPSSLRTERLRAAVQSYYEVSNG